MELILDWSSAFPNQPESYKNIERVRVGKIVVTYMEVTKCVSRLLLLPFQLPNLFTITLIHRKLSRKTNKIKIQNFVVKENW